MLPFLYIGLLLCSIRIKRAQDLNKSALFAMTMTYLPVINLFFEFYLIFFKGQATENRYGPPCT